MPTPTLMRAVVLAGILFVSFSGSFGQDQSAVSPEGGKQTITPEKRALIADLLEVTETRKNALALIDSMNKLTDNQMSDVIWQSMESRSDVRGLTQAQKDELRKKMIEESVRSSKRFRELFSRRIDINQIIEDLFYELYDRHFTEAEIKDLLSFYRSATGKKSIAMQPQMFAEAMSGTFERVKPKMIELMTEFSNEEAERIRKELQIETSAQPAKPKPKRRSRKRG
jgi:hypothetical protein